jgi:pyroglutamyl-peptidase
MDAGHYLCDFIYYCSLAEVARAIKPYEEKRRTPQVLFLHCPPIGQPLSTDEVTDALKKIVIWVCNEILIQSARDEAAVAAGVAADAPLLAPAVGNRRMDRVQVKKPGPVGGARA